MCRRRRRKQQEDTTPFNQADIDAALAAERAKAAEEATAAAEKQDQADANLGTVQASDTAAANMTGLQQTVDQMGGSMEAMKAIQEQSFRQVEDAKEKERLAIKRRKEQQLQRAIRQRKQTGLTGRRSLITGTAGGKGYA